MWLITSFPVAVDAKVTSHKLKIKDNDDDDKKPNAVEMMELCNTCMYIVSSRAIN